MIGNNTKRDQLREAHEESELVDMFYMMMGFIYSVKPLLTNVIRSFLKKRRIK